MQHSEGVRGGGRRSVIWAAAGLVIGLLAAGVFLLLWPAEYTSTAVLRVVPPQIPEHFVAVSSPLNVESLAEEVAPEVLSRNSVSNLISTYDLYPRERALLPLEDVIEKVTPKIRIDRVASSDSALELAFTYSEPDTAQKVTRDFMTKFIDETIRKRSAASKMTTEFFKEQREEAARDWQDLMQVAGKAAASDARTKLDLDLARERYERVSRQFDQSQMMTDVETRRQGATIEVLDLPNLPERRDPVLGLGQEWILAIGGAAGAVLGLVAYRWVRARTIGAPEADPVEA